MNTTKQNHQVITTTKTLNVKQLAVLLATITKSTVISLTYFVDESKSRTISGNKQVQKRVKVNNLYLNHDYSNKVKNLTGSTEFVANELNGKTRICSTIIASKSKKNFGKLMLDGKILHTESTNLLGYFHNGLSIELDKNNPTIGRNDLVAPSFYQKSTYTSGRGLVSQEDDFRMITPFLDNVETIKIQGQDYLIKS
tara:strand:- start:38350 stop:38940 length:591 start_codon:yes stop_codon:yes gene_type:complete